MTIDLSQLFDRIVALITAIHNFLRSNFRADQRDVKDTVQRIA